MLGLGLGYSNYYKRVQLKYPVIETEYNTLSKYNDNDKIPNLPPPFLIPLFFFIYKFFFFLHKSENLA